MEGICPFCEQQGTVGKLCQEKVCARRRYHLIPMNSFQRAQKVDGLVDQYLGLTVKNYVFVEKLGQGGMGAVYLALQVPLERYVAVKIIPEMDRDEVTIKRFQREARAMSLIEHPNIVKLYDYGVSKLGGSRETPFMVLEYVGGSETVATRLKTLNDRSESFPAPVLIKIFGQVLDALGEAHRTGFIHRDIKPDNIMLTRVQDNPSFVKILDFGLAKAVAGASTEEQLTRTGTALGTPTYIAPEQVVSGIGEVDNRSDLYSTAVMLFICMMKFNPYRGKNLRESLAKKIDPRYNIFARPDLADVPGPLMIFFQRALNTYPLRRYSDTEEMKRDMISMLSHRKVIQWIDSKRQVSFEGELQMDPTEHVDLAQLIVNRSSDGKSSDGGAIITELDENDLDVSSSNGWIIWLSLGLIALIIIVVLVVTLR